MSQDSNVQSEMPGYGSYWQPKVKPTDANEFTAYYLFIQRVYAANRLLRHTVITFLYCNREEAKYDMLANESWREMRDPDSLYLEAFLAKYEPMTNPWDDEEDVGEQS